MMGALSEGEFWRMMKTSKLMSTQSSKFRRPSLQRMAEHLNSAGAAHVVAVEGHPVGNSPWLSSALRVWRSDELDRCVSGAM